MLGLVPWLEVTGAVLVIVSTSLGIIGVVGTFFKRQIARMIDAKLDPIYRRLDEHMSAEDEYLAEIAKAMARLADTWQES